ncbi:hypothetical protein RUM44_006190 [Polyplax serrata]|uniref:Uncharacterized protein n=1 Tax=Polyplax serrata TaxID=468196 RepID=A0ABR1B140_POLSC
MNPRHNGLNEKDRSKEEDPNGKGKETGDDNLFNVWVKGGFHPEVHRGEKETYGGARCSGGKGEKAETRYEEEEEKKKKKKKKMVKNVAKLTFLSLTLEEGEEEDAEDERIGIQ